MPMAAQWGIVALCMVVVLFDRVRKSEYSRSSQGNSCTTMFLLLILPGPEGRQQ